MNTGEENNTLLSKEDEIKENEEMQGDEVDFYLLIF